MKILQLEDNQDDIEALRRAIGRWGKNITLTVVGTLAEAIRLLNDHDAAVIDLSLPDADIGRDLSLLKVFEVLPSVVFTGVDDPDLAYQIGKTGVGVMPKDSPAESLLCMIANQIGQFERVDESRSELRGIRAEFEKSGGV